MRKHAQLNSVCHLFMRICPPSSSFDFYSTTSHGDLKNDFDYLTFAQTWPMTACINWMTSNDENACILPKQRDSWIIHGIWPAKFGSFGPEFCENGAQIQMDAMQPIIERMRQNWPTIHKGTQ